ncbi:MAG: SRPBCC family protein [Bacteroidales bacterium]|nr:SRPBCC family protein [Bacteroidales bacterium]
MNEIKRIQQLPIDIDEAWEFFSNPRNLQAITPNDMGFVIKSDLPDHMYPGLIIRYKVRPLFGIPLTWVTEITHVEDPFYFVDNQLSGPFKLWHHKHFFREIDGGTEMTDLVHFSSPLGVIGKIADEVMVKKRVNQIFTYRNQVLQNKFGSI